MPRQRKDVPWLEQRDNGVYYAFWYNPDRLRVEKESLRTSDASEAARAFGHFLIQGPKSERGIHGGHSGAAGLTVWQALDDYWREHVSQVDDRGRPYVVDTERQATIISHLKAHFGDDMPIRAVGPLECRAYTEARRTGKIGGGKRRTIRNGSDATIRRELNLLVAAANHAIKWSKTESPRLTIADFPKVELPPEERNAEEAPWLTKAQISELLERAMELGLQDGATATQKRLRDFILLAYYTAARRRSIEKLTKFQVNLATGRITLMPPGKKETKKRQPIVPIFPEIRPTVERLMGTDGPWLLGGQFDFYRQFIWLLEEMGIEGHPHMLRHSRATHLLMSGESIYKVGRLLGDSVKTVENVYGHHSPEFLNVKAGSGLQEAAAD